MSCSYVKITLVPVIIVGFLIFPACRPSKTDEAVEPGTTPAHTAAKTTEAPAAADAPAEVSRADAAIAQNAEPVVEQQDIEKPAVVTLKETASLDATSEPVEPRGTGGAKNVAEGDSVVEEEAPAPSPAVVSIGDARHRISEEKRQRIQDRMSGAKQATPSRRVHDRLDAAERAILEQWDKVTSISASVKAIMNEGNAAGGASVISYGTYELQRSDKYSKIRLNLTTEREVRAEGTTSIQDDSVQLLIDGEYAYTLYEQDGKLRGTKTNPSTKDLYLFGGRPLFMQLHQEYSVKLLKDEILDGRPVYVIGSTSKEVDIMAKHYFDKETGVLLKVIAPGGGGRVATIEFSEIELNPTFPEDHFVWQEPVGVWMKDLRSGKSKIITPVE